VVIVTADNPRDESAADIAGAILGGMRRQDDVIVELDRRAAIDLAFSRARPGDLVLVAGKGHETEQVVGDQVSHFDDREVAVQLLLARTS
jgi:UDP-N-acetylmuramoyl-L-alanyl-D-glutamate--2,6-diaminopimelate ligase